MIRKPVPVKCGKCGTVVHAAQGSALALGKRCPECATTRRLRAGFPRKRWQGSARLATAAERIRYGEAGE